MEAHASGCRVCTDIARDAVAMAGEGASHSEIRAQIDADYVDVGVGTDTPLP